MRVRTSLLITLAMYFITLAVYMGRMAPSVHRISRLLSSPSRLDLRRPLTVPSDLDVCSLRYHAWPITCYAFSTIRKARNFARFPSTTRANCRAWSSRQRR